MIDSTITPLERFKMLQTAHGQASNIMAILQKATQALANFEVAVANDDKFISINDDDEKVTRTELVECVRLAKLNLTRVNGYIDVLDGVVS